MPRTLTFQTRIDTSKLPGDTAKIRQLIEAAYAPVNFRVTDATSGIVQVAGKLRAEFRSIATTDITKPLDDLKRDIEQTDVKAAQLVSTLSGTNKARPAAGIASNTAAADSGRVQRETAILEIVKRQVDAENKKNEVALAGLREQITLSTRLSQVKLEGERDVVRLAEQRRREELATAKRSNVNVDDVETRHVRERIAEERRLQALVEEVNRNRLQAEQRLEQVASRNAIERINGEVKVAAAVERTASARLAEAQTALRGAQGNDGRVAAEHRVEAAIQEVTNAQKARAEVQNRLAAEQISAEQRIAAAAERAAKERIAAEQRVQRVRQQSIRDENKLKPTAGAGIGKALGGINSAANLLTGGIAAFATVQLIRQINNTVKELNTLRVEASRSKISLDILSGGAGIAADRIAAIQEAGRGTITTLQAIQIGTQAAALGLANETEEFGRLATAARAVTLVSPIIHDIQSALSEISLAGANQSFRRLDQLGLGVNEVKNKIGELQRANASLSDEQAFSAAVVDTLINKYGKLLETTEAQASGQEKLTVAWQEFKLALADTAPIQKADEFMGFLGRTLELLKVGLTGDFSFFGNADEINAKIDEQTDKLNALREVQAQSPDTFNANAEIRPVTDHLDALRALLVVQEELTEAQKQGISVSGEYAKTIADFTGEIATQNVVTKDQKDQLKEFQAVVKAINNLESGDTAGSKVFVQAQEALGDSFIKTDESAITLTRGLIELNAQLILHKITAEEHAKRLETIRIGYVLLTGAAGDLQRAQAAQQKAQLLDAAESNLIKTINDEVAGVVEATGDLEKAGKDFEAKKQFIIDSIANISNDVKADELPLIIAKIKFDVQFVTGDAPTSAGSAVLNSSIFEELQNLAIDKNKAKREELRDARRELTKEAEAQAEAILESGGSWDEALAFLEGKQEEIRLFFADLPKNITAEEFTLRFAAFKIEAFDEGQLRKSAQSAFDDASAAVQEAVSKGFDPTVAVGLLAVFREKVAAEYAKIPEGLQGDALAVAISEANRRIGLEVEKFVQIADFSEIKPSEATAKINEALASLNNAAVDATPGLVAVREELLALYDEIARSGGVTFEQVKVLDELLSITDAIGQSTGEFASEVIGLDSELFSTNEEAAGLFDTIAKLEGAYINGKVPIDEYSGRMLSLINRLIEVAKEAGITGKALDDLIGLSTLLEASAFSGTTGFESGRVAGNEESERIRIEAEKDKRAEDTKTAERAARAFEQAAERAAKAFEAKLGNVPGLFSPSSVTQEQLDLAKAGIPQNFADDFVRRLEDLVKNGVKRPGVSIDRAKEALANVGVDASKATAEQVLLLIKQKFADSSLFANKENLELINFDAVQSNLDLQNQAEQGKNNIIDYLKSVHNMAVSDLTGGGSGGVGTPGAPGSIGADSTIGSADATAKLNLVVDEEAINAAATKSAQLFAKVFSDYDFSTLTISPIGAMEASLANEKIANRVVGVGSSMADLVKSGFTNRSSEVDWLTAIVSAMEAEVTGNVLSALAS